MKRVYKFLACLLLTFLPNLSSAAPAQGVWSSLYSGVTPASSLELAFNNIGIYNSSDATIYTCLRVFTDGLPDAVGGIAEFDIGFTIYISFRKSTRCHIK
jgi:hypothetical protein